MSDQRELSPWSARRALTQQINQGQGARPPADQLGHGSGANASDASSKVERSPAPPLIREKSVPRQSNGASSRPIAVDRGRKQSPEPFGEQHERTKERRHEHMRDRYRDGSRDRQSLRSYEKERNTYGDKQREKDLERDRGRMKDRSQERSSAQGRGSSGERRREKSSELKKDRSSNSKRANSRDRDRARTSGRASLQERERRHDRSADRRRDRSTEKRRDRSGDRHRDRSRDRRRDHSTDKRHDRSRDRRRDRSNNKERDCSGTDRRDRARPRSRDHSHRHRRSRSPLPYRPSKYRSPSFSPPPKRRKRSPSRSRSKKPLPSQEVSFRGTDNSTTAPTKYGGAPSTLEKPNFRPTGLLAKVANTVQGTKIALKYHEPAEARKPPPSQQWKLFVFKGDAVIDTLDLYTRSCWLLGREARVVDHVLEHPSSSGQHAVVQFRYVQKTEEDELGVRQVKGRVKPYVLDLESSNGTELNGEKVEASRYVELRDKDILKFAGSEREYVVVLPPAEK